ncbi:hypothetical protein D3C85_568780 [compost metagenome]
MTGFNQDFAFLKHDAPLLFIETHIQRTVGIEIDQRAVSQTQGALLANGGALVGQPIVDRQVTIPGEQGQADHGNDTGDTVAKLAHSPANAFARLQQGSAGRAAGHAETLVEHAQLAPGAGVLFVGRVPLGELFALYRVGGVHGQLPGNRRVQHAGRYRFGTDRVHVGSPYSAI